MSKAQSVNVCSADHFFMKDGFYNFQGRLLPVAHMKCKEKYRCFLENGIKALCPDDEEGCEVFHLVKPTLVVALQGPSGVGKTTFIKTVIPVLYPGERVVVVDNTNCSVGEVAWYHDEAGLQKVKFEILRLQPECWDDPNVICERGPAGDLVLSKDLEAFVVQCVERNIHGVPRASIEGMVERLRQNQPFFPPWYKIRKVTIGDGEWRMKAGTFTMAGEVLVSE